MLTLVLATAAAVVPIPPTQLLTWAGVVAVVLGLVLSGLLVPRVSHQRELRILKESQAEVVAGLRAQLARADAEIAVWRGVATVQQTTSTELLAQHRLALDGLGSINYSIGEMRHGLERALERTQKEGTPG